jgi:hypothetical protein
MKHGVVYTAGVDAEAGRKSIENPFIVGAYEHPLSDHRRVGTLAEPLAFSGVGNAALYHFGLRLRWC